MGQRVVMGLAALCLTATLLLAGTPALAITRPAAPRVRSHGQTRIVLYGDSLVSEAGQDFSYLAKLSGASVQVHTFPGTAICNFFTSMATVAQDWRPTVAMLAFTGDAFTPCMDGLQIGSPPYFERYKDDTETAITTFRSVGAQVILVGLPADAAATLTQNAFALNRIYQAIARQDPGVTYSDVGQAVLAKGRFSWTLPCIPGQPCTAPGHTNVVRAPDGVHFCPNGRTTLVAGFEACDVYSSGAFRFASAMLKAALGAATPVPLRTTRQAG